MNRRGALGFGLGIAGLLDAVPALLAPTALAAASRRASSTLDLGSADGNVLAMAKLTGDVARPGVKHGYYSGVLDRWLNPYTGETVEPFHIANPAVNRFIRPVLKDDRFYDRVEGSAPKERAFVLPWKLAGDRAKSRRAPTSGLTTRWIPQ